MHVYQLNTQGEAFVLFADGLSSEVSPWNSLVLSLSLSLSLSLCLSLSLSFSLSLSTHLYLSVRVQLFSC